MMKLVTVRRALRSSEVVPRAARSLFAVAVAAAMTFGFAGEARATAYGSSILELSNASFSGPGFDSFLFTLQPISATLIGDTNASASTGLKTGNKAGTTLNQPLTCVDDSGACAGFVDNGYFPSPSPFAPPGNYAVADSDQTNTLISAGTAHLGSKAVANLKGSSFGNAQTGTANSAEWDLAAHAATKVQFKGNLVIDAEVFADTLISTAQTTSKLNIAIVQTGLADIILFDAAIDPRTKACVNLSVAGPAGADHPCDDLIVTIDSGLVDLSAAGSKAQRLRITFDTSSTVTQQVPAPAAMMLMGSGLLAVGLVVRRRFAGFDSSGWSCLGLSGGCLGPRIAE